MTDYKQLCAELADELDAATGYTRKMDGKRITHPDVARARAALAEPEPEWPTDEELMEAFDGEFAEFFDSSDGFGTTAIPRSEWIKVARAVLARWGRPVPQPSADGEVAELVRKLREQAAAYNAYPGHAPLIEEWAQCFTRAADLLERQAAPVQAVEALAARPLLEQVAAIGDCISEQTVGQVRALADRAAAWLAENPPGQSPVTAEGEVAELVSLLRAEAADDEVEDHMLWMTPADARRAADLLERQP